MAERRMFAKTIIDSDAFIDMPSTSRLLYYDLAMRADDDGFVNSPKKIAKMTGASQDDLGILAMRKFIIPFDNGVVVIKHWRIHNYIRKDTYNETPYLEEKAMLELDDNKAYTMRKTTPVDDTLTQVRLGKDSIGYINNSTIEEEKHYFENEKLNEAFLNWLQYKKEKKQTYKETGLKTLINKINKQLVKQSVESVIEDIENCMSRNYSGIFFRNETSTKNTQVINAPSWVEEHIASTKQTETIREETIEDLERFFG